MTDRPRFTRYAGPPNEAHLDYNGGRLVAFFLRRADAAAAKKSGRRFDYGLQALSALFLAALVASMLTFGSDARNTSDTRNDAAADTNAKPSRIGFIPGPSRHARRFIETGSVPVNRKMGPQRGGSLKFLFDARSV
jgi:hypothetical protein